MRLQSSQSACGRAAAANALRALGYTDVTETAVERWVNRVRRDENPADGHDENLLTRAIVEGRPRKYRLHVEQMQVHDAGLALASLRGYLESGWVAILSVDDDDHWVVAIGRCGDRFTVIDAADEELALCLDPPSLLNRWKTAGNPAGFFAIVIKRS